MTGDGAWASAADACFVQANDYMASEAIINVGRRAGLYIPEAPAHVIKVSNLQDVHAHAYMAHIVADLA